MKETRSTGQLLIRSDTAAEAATATAAAAAAVAAAAAAAATAAAKRRQGETDSRCDSLVLFH